MGMTLAALVDKVSRRLHLDHVVLVGDRTPDQASRVMRCRACLNAHRACQKISEEGCNLAALKLSRRDDTVTGVDAADLEDSLREIKTNRGNLHDGRKRMACTVLC